MKNMDLAVMGLVLILVGLGLCVLSVIDFLDDEIVDVPGAVEDPAGLESPTIRFVLAGGLVVLGLLLSSAFRVTRARDGSRPPGSSNGRDETSR